MSWKSGLLFLALGLPAWAGPADPISVTGRVLRPGGVPVAEVEVQLIPVLPQAAIDRLHIEKKTGPDPVARTKTAANGAFQLMAPRSGVFSVTLSASGFVPLQSVPLPLVEELTLPDAWLSRDEGLLITVTADGRPVAGARVETAPSQTKGRFPLGPAAVWKTGRQNRETGPQGTVSLASPPGDQLEIAVAAPGFGPAAIKRFHSGAAVLALRRGIPIDVQLLSAQGLPLAGVTAACSGSNIPIAISDSTGRMMLELPSAKPTEVEFRAPSGTRLTVEIDPPLETPSKPLTIAWPAPSVLSGRVIDSRTRKTVSGALVFDDGEESAAVLTDRSGRFTLNALAQPARLIALAAGFLRFDRPQAATAAQETVIALQPAAGLEGRVIDPQGRGVADAYLEVHPARIGFRRGRPGGGPAGGDRTVPTARSRTDGRFKMNGLDPENPTDLWVQAAGFAKKRIELTGLSPDKTKTGLEVKLTPGVVVTGLVVDLKDQPINGAEILLEPRPGADGPGVGAEMEGTTDQGGHFSIKELPPGLYSINASGTGFAQMTLPPRAFTEDEPEIDIGRIVLAPGTALEGTVVDRAGRPIEGVHVFASTVNSRSGAALRSIIGDRPQAVSAADGHFSLDGRRPGEKVNLLAQRSGFAAHMFPGISVPPEQPLVLTLSATGAIEGRVEDRSGKPIPLAQVELFPGRGRGGGLFGPRGGFRQEAAIDESGRFRCEDLEPGGWTLRARAAGYQDQQLDGLILPEGKDLTGVVVQLDPGAFVEGHVLAPDGTPAISAEVGTVAGSPTGFPGSDSNRTLTDGDGYYRLDGLGPGDYSIEATTEGWPRAVKDFRLKSGGNRLDLQFQGGWDISGRVLDSSGLPVARADVRLATGGRGMSGSSAVSAEDGGFLLTGILDGDYQLTAGRAGYAAAAVQTVKVAGQPVSGLIVQLEAGGLLTGRISGVSTAELTGVTLRASRSPSDRPLIGQPDPEGEYRLEHAAPGDWTVTAGLVTSNGTSLETRGKVTLTEGQPEARLDLQFERGYSLTGQVLLGETPIAGARVSLGGSNQLRGEAVTDINGQFQIEGLKEGTYSITVDQPQQNINHRETVSVVGDKEIVIHLAPMKVAGRALDGADRAPLQGVQVTLLPLNPAGGTAARPIRAAAPSNADGYFELINVPAGEYRIAAEKQGFSPRSSTVTVAEDIDVTHAEVLLDASQGLLLQVALPAGRSAEHVLVAVLDGTGARIGGGNYPTGENGRVRLDSIPAGSWELLIASEGTAVSALTVTAPGGPIPLVLSPACELAVEVPALAEATGPAQARLFGADGRPFRSLRGMGNPVSTWNLSQGKGRFFDLPPGSFTVVVTGPDGSKHQGTAQTQPGVPTKLILD